ncbi:MAG: SDR family oxidoreductase [Anaerolineales bacterium]
MILKGKTALVTGAAHRVGRSLALALADRGCNLVLHYHHAQAESEAAIRQALERGVRAHPAMADLRDPAQLEELFSVVDREFGGLDVLIQSAAIMEPVDLLLATAADWHRTIDLNLRAAFFGLQLAARRMRARGGGAIVNISDIAAHRPWRRYPIHSISKAGVEMLTRVAALALAPDIRVNAIAPGPVLKPSILSEERWAEISQALPLQRAGTPLDVARAMIFLLENDYVTGETVLVDGGDRLSRD